MVYMCVLYVCKVLMYVLYVFTYSILRICLLSVPDVSVHGYVPIPIYIGIASLMGAGIKLWVLTGDKEGTAINVAIACNVLQVGQNYDSFRLTYSLCIPLQTLYHYTLTD